MERMIAAAKEYNRSGKHRETLVLLGQAWAEQLRNPEDSLQRHAFLRGLYYYAEAALLDEQFALAQQAAERFEAVLTDAADHEEIDQDIRLMRLLLQAVASLTGSAEECRRGLRSLNRSLGYGGAKPEWDVRMKYVLALADCLDDNVIDGKRKLSELTPEEEALFTEPIRQLNRRLEERSRLDFRALRAGRRAFVEIGTHDAWIAQLCLSPGGTLVAAMHQDGELKLLHTESGEEAASFSDSKALFEAEKASEAALAFSPDARYLAVGFGVGMVKIYDLREQQLHAAYDCPGLDWEQLDDNAYYEEYTYVTFSATGRYLIVVPTAANYDPQGDIGYPIPEPYRTFYCIDLKSGRVVLQHTFADRSKIAAIAISPDEKWLAVGLFGKRMTIWNVETGQCLYDDASFVWLGLPSRVGMTQTIAFSRDSRKLLYAARETVRIVHLTDSFRTEDIPMPQGRVCCALCFDSQDSVVAAQYVHNEPAYIVKYPSGCSEEAMLIKHDSQDVDSIWIDEERGELWVYSSPVLQVRNYSSSELIKAYDPYQWSYSPYVIGNSVSVEPKSGMAAISFRSKVRLA